jgi:hypothetical protein
MVSAMERRKHTRSKHPAGSVSRHAQQRVNENLLQVPWVVSPARKGWAEVAEAQHRERDNGFL